MAPTGPQAATARARLEGVAVKLRTDDEPLDEQGSVGGADARMTLNGTRVPDPLVLDNGDTIRSV